MWYYWAAIPTPLYVVLLGKTNLVRKYLDFVWQPHDKTGVPWRPLQYHVAEVKPIQPWGLWECTVPYQMFMAHLIWFPKLKKQVWSHAGLANLWIMGPKEWWSQNQKHFLHQKNVMFLHLNWQFSIIWNNLPNNKRKISMGSMTCERSKNK